MCSHYRCQSLKTVSLSVLLLNGIKVRLYSSGQSGKKHHFNVIHLLQISFKITLKLQNRPKQPFLCDLNHI
ncbi:hypothetical protein Q4Q68_10655, partial [Morganella morganii]